MGFNLPGGLIIQVNLHVIKRFLGHRTWFKYRGWSDYRGDMIDTFDCTLYTAVTEFIYQNMRVCCFYGQNKWGETLVSRLH